MEYFAGLDVSMAESTCVSWLKMAPSSTTRKYRPRLLTLRPSLRRFRPASGWYLRPVAWRRCSITA